MAGWTWATDVTVTDADFVSTDSMTIVNQFTAARGVDNSLPNFTALKLAATSDLIDAGTNVGLPYYGTAPDIGAFEYQEGEIINPDPDPDQTANDSIIVTTAQQLNDSLSINRSPGDVVYVNSNSLTGTFTFSASGNASHLIIVKPSGNRNHARLVGNVNLTGQYIKMEGLTIEGCVNIANDNVILKHDSIVSSPLTALRAINRQYVTIDSCTLIGNDTTAVFTGVRNLIFTHNKVTGDGNFIFTPPDSNKISEKKMFTYNINYNHYISTGSGLKWNGKSFWWFWATYIKMGLNGMGFDRQSIYERE